MEKSRGNLLNWVRRGMSSLAECVLLHCQKTGFFWQWNNGDSYDLKNGKNSWQEWRSVLVGSLHGVLDHGYWFSPSKCVVVNVIYALTFSQLSAGMEKHGTDTYRWVYLSLAPRKCRIDVWIQATVQSGGGGGGGREDFPVEKNIWKSLFRRHCCR